MSRQTDPLEAAERALSKVKDRNDLVDPDVIRPIIRAFAGRHFGRRGAEEHATFVKDIIAILAADAGKAHATPPALELVDDMARSTIDAYSSSAYLLGLMAGVRLWNSRPNKNGGGRPVLAWPTKEGA